jgi:hypothetical protein
VVQSLLVPMPYITSCIAVALVAQDFQVAQVFVVFTSWNVEEVKVNSITAVGPGAEEIVVVTRIDVSVSVSVLEGLVVKIVLKDISQK